MMNLPPECVGLAVIGYHTPISNLFEPEPLKITWVAGWLVAEHDKVIVLCSKRDEDGAEQFITIPKGCIVRKAVLRETPPPEEDGGFPGGYDIVPGPDDPVWQPS